MAIGFRYVGESIQLERSKFVGGSFVGIEEVRKGGSFRDECFSGRRRDGEDVEE